MLKTRLFCLLMILSMGVISISVLGPRAATGATLVSGLGGPEGFGQLAMGRNDDGSSGRLNLPFTANFFGNSHSSFFVNNNGNLTFNGALSRFTPNPFPVANQPMIAPYWADVDTRCVGCGQVYVAAPNPNTVVVTWNGVGFYNSNSTLTNTFQTVLRNRSETGSGNFDIEFRYAHLNWTTGDASGGSGGLGGTPAQAGFDAGDSRNFFTLPGSRTANVLNLQNTSNLPSAEPGMWSFAVRNGDLPGSSPANPLLPVVTQNGFNFDFNVGDINDRIYIDPVVAIGYDYLVNSGPNFQSVLLPTGIGDNQYDLQLFDAGLNTFVDSGIDITGGTVHNFRAGGIDRFRILGIETDEALDPNDPRAFVTGLTFTETGQANVSMNPIRFDTDLQPVPLPSTMILFGVGLLGLGALFLRREMPVEANC